MIPDVLGGLVLVGPADRGPFSPVAVWPRMHGDMRPLTVAAERVLKERRRLVVQPEEGTGGRPRLELAQPIEIDGALHGAVVLDVAPRAQAEVAEALQQLAWGFAWLEAFHRRQAAGREATGRERLQTLLQLVAAAVERDRYREAATHFATEVATQLACDRVSLGVIEEDRVVLQALSHSAQFGKKSNLIRAIEAAMEEAVEQERSIVYASAGTTEPHVVRAHAELAQQFGSRGGCSVPLVREGCVVGVITLERGGERVFDEDEVAVAEAAAALVGPILEVQRREDRWLGTKVWSALRTRIDELLGPRHVAVKLVVTAVALVVLFLAFARGDYRVTAETILEPEVRRAVVAPFDGYLGEATLRAGDLVEEGQLLASLDDRELALERLSWESEVQPLSKQNRQARAEGNAAEVRILSAGVERARARLELIEDRIARSRLYAPLDGVIVAGDLSQALGAPVERGEVLFEIAPLDAYRVILEVDESDIRDVSVGQEGSLVLASSPDDSIGFRVKQITPISVPEEGRNYFRVEAELQRTPERLRPGMEGVGKIEVDRRRLVWIWTHTVIDWLRLSSWRWLP
jgi:multidrug resistance efflux pump